jgi:hypothetical protein
MQFFLLKEGPEPQMNFAIQNLTGRGRSRNLFLSRNRVDAYFKKLRLIFAFNTLNSCKGKLVWPYLIITPLQHQHNYAKVITRVVFSIVCSVLPCK